MTFRTVGDFGKLTSHFANVLYFSEFWHEDTFYAGSEFLQSKKRYNSGKQQSNTSYNQTHSSIPEGDTHWTSIYEAAAAADEDDTEEKRLARMLAGQTSFDHAMTFDNDIPEAQSWRHENKTNGASPSKSSKKKKNNNKKAKASKRQYWRNQGMYCACTSLALDKRRETVITISNVQNQRCLYVQQPTHPSFFTLDVLEQNLFNFYSPQGDLYNEDKNPGCISRAEARSPTHYCTVQDPYNPIKFVRAKVS